MMVAFWASPCMPEAHIQLPRVTPGYPGMAGQEPPVSDLMEYPTLGAVYQVAPCTVTMFLQWRVASPMRAL